MPSRTHATRERRIFNPFAAKCRAFAPPPARGGSKSPVSIVENKLRTDSRFTLTSQSLVVQLLQYLLGCFCLVYKKNLWGRRWNPYTPVCAALCSINEHTSYTTCSLSYKRCTVSVIVLYRQRMSLYWINIVLLVQLFLRLITTFLTLHCITMMIVWCHAVSVFVCLDTGCVGRVGMP